MQEILNIIFLKCLNVLCCSWPGQDTGSSGTARPAAGRGAKAVQNDAHALWAALQTHSCPYNLVPSFSSWILAQTLKNDQYIILKTHKYTVDMLLMSNSTKENY